MSRQAQLETGLYVNDDANQRQTEHGVFVGFVSSGTNFSGSPAAGSLVLTGAVPVFGRGTPPRQAQLESGLYLSDSGNQRQTEDGIFVVPGATIGGASFNDSPSAAGIVITGTVPTLVGAAGTRGAQTESGLYSIWTLGVEAQTESGVFIAPPRIFTGRIPSGAVLTLTGTVPTLTIGGFQGVITSAQLTLRGQQPTLAASSFSDSPTNGQLIVTGVALALDQSTSTSGNFSGIIVQFSSLILVGQVPALVYNSGGFSGVPNPAALGLQGTQPTLLAPFNQGMAGAALNLIGNQPTIFQTGTLLSGQSQLSGQGKRGTRAKGGLTYEDWQAYVNYKQQVKAVQAAKAVSAKAAAAEVEKPAMPALATLAPHELAPTAKALNTTIAQLRQAQAVAQQAQEEDELQALMLID